MDRASILGDAVEYMNELLQKIKDLTNELESMPPGSSVLPTDSSNFSPSTPPPPTLPCRVKAEISPSPSPLASPSDQSAKVCMCIKISFTSKNEMIYFPLVY